MLAPLSRSGLIEDNLYNGVERLAKVDEIHDSKKVCLLPEPIRIPEVDVAVTDLVESARREVISTRKTAQRAGHSSNRDNRRPSRSAGTQGRNSV